MLEGLLVDLVPYGKAFTDLEHRWRNHEASFYGSGGDRYFVTQAMVRRMMQEWAEERERGEDPGVAFGIRTKDGKPIGYMGINWLVPYYRLAMLGAKIGEPEYWGGGYGTDALLLLLEYAFDWLDIRKAWLMTTTMNHRVMRQMEKVGFTLEAQQRHAALADGVWYDWLAYGLLREEWPGRAAVIERIGLHAREKRTMQQKGCWSTSFRMATSSKDGTSLERQRSRVLGLDGRAGGHVPGQHRAPTAERVERAEQAASRCMVRDSLQGRRPLAISRSTGWSHHRLSMLGARSASRTTGAAPAPTRVAADRGLRVQLAGFLKAVAGYDGA